MTKPNATWVTQPRVGWTVVPSTRMRRVACLMTARMYCHRPVNVTVSMKSQGQYHVDRLRRSAAQVVTAARVPGLCPCP